MYTPNPLRSLGIPLVVAHNDPCNLESAAFDGLCEALSTVDLEFRSRTTLSEPSDLVTTDNSSVSGNNPQLELSDPQDPEEPTTSSEEESSSPTCIHDDGDHPIANLILSPASIATLRTRLTTSTMTNQFDINDDNLNNQFVRDMVVMLQSSTHSISTFTTQYSHETALFKKILLDRILVVSNMTGESIPACNARVFSLIDVSVANFEKLYAKSFILNRLFSSRSRKKAQLIKTFASVIAHASILTRITKFIVSFASLSLSMTDDICECGTLIGLRPLRHHVTSVQSYKHFTHQDLYSLKYLVLSKDPYKTMSSKAALFFKFK